MRQTFTVFDCEAREDPSAAVSGLTLEQAAAMLFERSGRVHEIRRTDRFSVLCMSDADGDLVETDVVSPSDEPAVARREIYERIVGGAVPLPGPCMAMPDEEYRRELARAAFDVDDGEAELLVRLWDGHYRSLLDPADRRVAEGLVARGILQVLQQRRYKGASPLYRIARPDDEAGSDMGASHRTGADIR